MSECICGEINARHCPVHTEGLSEASERVIKRLEDDGVIPNQKLKHCKKIVTAVYLAADESVAKDISEHLHWLIEAYERLERELAEWKEKYISARLSGAMEGRDEERARSAALVEALRHYESAHYCNCGFACFHDKTAREAIREYEESE